MSCSRETACHTWKSCCRDRRAGQGPAEVTWGVVGLSPRTITQRLLQTPGREEQ